MTKEQLKEGKRLLERIGELETQIDFWVNAAGIEEIQLMYKGHNTYVRTVYMPFEAVKALTLTELQRELNAVKEKFEKL